jgi:ATP-dependent Lon protease
VTPEPGPTPAEAGAPPGDAARPGPPALPDSLPVLPLRGAVVLPFAAVPLTVGQPRSIRLIDDAMRGGRLLAVVAQRDPAMDNAGPDDLYRVGTAAAIHQLARGPDGALRLIVQGLERIRITGWVGTEPYLVARIEAAPDQAAAGTELEALRQAAIDLFRRLVELIPDVPGDLVGAVETLPDPRQVAYFIGSLMPLEPAVRQQILELDAVDGKLRRLIDQLQRELAVRELGRKIASDTEERLTKQQREH